MKTWRMITLLIMALSAGSPMPAATPQTVVTDSLGITAFDLYNYGLIWWDGGGRCAGEFPHEATIRINPTITGGTCNLARDCAIMEGEFNRVVRDDAYVYYFSGRQLQRKALNAEQTEPGQALSTGIMTPTLLSNQPTAVLELADGRLYWPRRTTTHNYIYRMPTDASVEPDYLFRITDTNDVVKLQWFIMENGTDTQEAMMVLFSDGKLFRVLLTSPVDILELGTGIMDFAIHKARTLMGTGTTYCYGAAGRHVDTVTSSTPPGRLFRINAMTGDSTTIYTAQDNNQVLSVAVDPVQVSSPLGTEPKHIFIAEAIMTCGALLCEHTDTVLKRHTTPGATTGWEQFLTTGGGFNLRLTDEWVYFLRANGIRRIDRDAPAQELDFVADGLEVVQAIQDMNISVALVSRHPTFARGYAYTRTNTTGKVWQPQAYLYGYLNNQLLPGSPIEPVNRPDVEPFDPLTERRARPHTESYLFELPYEWMDIGGFQVPTATLQLKMVLNEDLAIAETGSDPLSNNSVWLKNPAAIVNKGRPCFTFVPLLTTGPICGFEHVSELVERARSLMPVADWAVNEYYWTLGDPEEPYAIGSDDEDIADDDKSRALDDLQDFGWYPCGDWGQRFFVGMVHPSMPNFNGVSLLGTDVMIARMETNDLRGVSWGGGLVLAHEGGHCYGRKHIMCGDFPEDQQNFDLAFYPCSLGVPDDYSPDAYMGWDYIRQKVITPTSAADVMSYRVDGRWTSHVYWNAMLFLTAPPPPKNALASPAKEPGEVLLLQGRLGRTEPRGYFRPIYTLPAAIVPADRLARHRAKAASLPKDAAACLLRQVDAAGGVLSETPLVVQEPHSEEVRRLSFDTFSQWVDLAPGVRSLQVVRSNQVWVERFISPNPPSLSIVTVRVDQAAQTLYLRWQAEDRDGDPLRFMVQVGDGAGWITMRRNYRGLEDTIDLRGLPGSPVTRVRLFATDGVRTAMALSDAFPIPNQPPRPTLSGVREGQRMAFGSPLVLRGRAFDPETGAASNTLALTLAGPSSQGQTGMVEALSLSIRALPPGAYTATLQATDPTGLSATATREFEILPITIPDGPAPTLDGQCNDPGYTNAPLIRMVWSGNQTIPVRLVHSGTNLYVSFSNLKYGGILRPNHKVGLRVEADGNGSIRPSSSDRGFFVDEDGIPSQEVGTGMTGMQITNSPAPGFTAIVRRSSNTWSAEFRIAQSLLGGWNHPARIMLEHATAEWPAPSNPDAPSSWAPVYFGTNPPPSINRAPVALAGASQFVRLRTPREVYLNGSSSYDPDGHELQFAWRQILGPNARLVNSNTPNPYFVAETTKADTRLVFELVVSDGTASSAPSQTEIILQPAALRPPEVVPSAYARLRADGTLECRLNGEPRKLYRLETSTDLVAWQPLRQVYADELGLVDLTESVNFSLVPKLFYRVVSP